jgi:endonuclease/exonuclease/phosphatase (EEP) superfamily protein YafD
MRRVVTGFFKWIANFWTIAVIGIIFLWINVAIELIPMDSRWIALGYLPPFWFIILLIVPIILFLLLRLYRRSAALIVLYLAFFLGFGDISLVRSPSYQFSRDDRTQKISVIALNLRYYSFGFDEIVDAINKLDADFFLLSENEISDEQIAAMKERVFPKVFHMGQQESTAIISRHPVLDFKEVKFPTRQASLFDGNTVEEIKQNPFRSFAHAIVDINGTKTHIISVRFIAGRAANRQLENVIRWGFHVLDAQQQELEFFLNYLDKLEGPVIFGGDLNATPTSIVMQTLSEAATDLYLQDHIWGGVTFGTSFPPRTNFPTTRLDYIFAANEVQPLNSRILDMVISDHYLVYAECMIPAGSSK